MSLKKIVILFLLIPFAGYSQYKNIKVNTLENNPCEVTIAINPLNPMNMVAASNLSNYFYSFDAGLTWEQGLLKSNEYGVWGDPCVVFDALGNIYYFHLSRPSMEQWIDRIVSQKSTDEGKSWSDPGTYMGLNHPKKQDKEWACTDITQSKWRNNIYVTWTQFDKYYFGNVTPDPLDSSVILFSRSTDGGESWSKAFRLSKQAGDCRDSANTTEGAVPCTGPNGEIYVSWSGPAGIVFDRSADGGINWLDDDISVSKQIGGWEYNIPGIYRCNGMPVTGCDISNGSHRGTIYVNFSDIRNGINDVDIFLVKSTDGGNNWSTPLRVNDDKQGNERQQFMSWMSVDPISGAVNIIYYDRRFYEDEWTDVYLARSTDGGQSFKNIKISEQPFKPTKKVFFGDYIGISSYNDYVACVWQRMDAGKLSIQYCGIDFK